MKKELKSDSSIYKSIIESQTEMIIRHKPDSTVIYANKSFLNFIGLNEEEFFGRKWFDLVKPEVVSEIKSMIQLATKKNPVQQYDQVIDSGGKRYWISWISTGIFSERGKLTEFQVVGRDITLGKQLEMDLINANKENQRLKEKYNTIIEFTQDMERWVSPEGELIYISPSCKRITGYSRDEFMKEHDLLGRIIIPEDQIQWKNRFHEYNRKLDIPDLEFRVRRKDDVIVTLSVASGSVFSQDGIYRGVRSSFRDISDRVKAESELKKALEEIDNLRKKLQDENIYLRGISELDGPVDRIISRSPAMIKIIEQISEIKNHTSTVLILGEPGTGKKYLANIIHNLSARNDRPLITIRCGSMHYQDIDEELFGGEWSDFNGNRINRPSRLELANGSTLILEEISQIPIDIQLKLAGFLESAEYECKGSLQRKKADVRIIATSSANLEEKLNKGHFHRQLFKMLGNNIIKVPALRERPEDIPSLAWQFLAEFNSESEKKIKHISDQSMEWLMHYSWPVNVKELRTTIESSVISSDNPTLEINVPFTSRHKTPWPSLEIIERNYIEEALRFTKGRIRGKKGASHLLGINEATLRYRIKKLGIKK